MTLAIEIIRTYCEVCYFNRTEEKEAKKPDSSLKTRHINRKLRLISHLRIETVCKCGFMLALIIHHWRIKRYLARLVHYVSYSDRCRRRPSAIINYASLRPSNPRIGRLCCCTHTPDAASLSSSMYINVMLLSFRQLL